MTVYVDDMEAKFGRMIMCHMIADSTEELLQMADSIGVAHEWIQHADTWKEHFDIAKVKKQLAIDHGAIPITQKELGQILIARKYKAPPKSSDKSGCEGYTDKELN